MSTINTNKQLNQIKQDIKEVKNQVKKKNKLSQRQQKTQKKKMIKALLAKHKKFYFTPINTGRYLPQQFVDNKANATLDYIASILDPAKVVNTGTIVKQPSLMPIYSTTVAYKDVYTISTSSTGEFALAWNPNFLTSTLALPTNIIDDLNRTYRPSHVAHIIVKNANTLAYYGGYQTSVDLSKYRLVSAKLEVSYVGPVLSRSGQIFACATYDPSPIRYVSDSTVPNYLHIDIVNNTPQIANADFTLPANTINQNYQVDKFMYDQMNEATIVNGLWNKTINVQKGDRSMVCLSIPTDPTSRTFSPMGSYFGEKTSTTPVNLTYSTTFTEGVTFVNNIVDTSVEGTQICYMVCGKGLPINSDCIALRVYYNFEIIPTANTAPYLRNPSMQNVSSKTAQIADEVIKNLDPEIISVRSEPIDQSFSFRVPNNRLNQIRNSANAVREGLNIARDIMNSYNSIRSGNL